MIPALEVVTGNVNVGSFPTINMGQVEGAEVEKFHSPEGVMCNWARWVYCTRARGGTPVSASKAVWSP